jgi:hypothetical protein
MHIARSHGPALYNAPRCNICSRGSADAVAIDNGSVCGDCLRRINADPLAKRRVLLAFDQLDW